MKKSYPFILLYLSTLLYYFLFYDYGLNLWDEGIGANGALRLLAGETTGADFLAYAPGRYYLFKWSFDLFGISLLSIRKMMVLLTAFMPVFAYLIAREIMPRYFAILSFFLILSAPSIYYNRFFPIFTIITLYFIIRFSSDITQKKFIHAIIAIILSLSFKGEIGLIASFCLGLGMVIEFRRFFNKKVIIRMAISCIVILVIAYFISPQHLIDHIKYRLYVIFILHGKWGNGFPDISIEALSKLHFFKIIESLLFYLPLPTYLATICYSYKKYGGWQNNRFKSIFLVSVMGLSTFNLVIWRAGFDNLIRVLPCFFISLTYLLSEGFEKMNRPYISSKKKKPIPLSSKRIAFNYSLFGIIPLMLTYNFSFNHGYYVGSIGAMRENKVLLNIKDARVYTNKTEAAWVEAITRYIQKKTRPGDYIFAIPLNPIWYFLTKTKNPTYYEWILPGSLMTGDKEQKEIIAELQTKKPGYVILSDIAIDNKNERKFSRYASLIYGYIQKNYKFINNVGIFQVLKLKKVTDSKAGAPGPA